MMGVLLPDVFLSYTRDDQAVAQRFAEALQAEHLSVWWGVTLRSGEAYDQVTEKALGDAKSVVVPKAIVPAPAKPAQPEAESLARLAAEAKGPADA